MNNFFLVLFILVISCYKKIEAQEFPPPVIYIPSNSFSITNENGIDIYRYKDNNKKVDGRIYIGDYIVGDTQHGIVGDKLLFIDGAKSGLWKYEDIESQLFYIVTYNKGLVVGLYRVYYKYNKPIAKKRGNYSFTTHIRADSIIYETNFVKGNGIWKDFYLNGNLKETGEYKSGKKEGEWLYYSENNRLYLKRYFEKGIQIDSVMIKNTQTEILEIRLDY